jgi:hypothetical protein
MTTERDPGTRIVLSWLREGAHENAERVLLRALDEVDTTPQRRPWWPARRFTDMNSYAKLAIAAAATVVVVVGGMQLLPGDSSSGGQPPGTPSPTVSPTQTAAPSVRLLGNGPLDPGQYAPYWSGPVITFQVPAGWRGASWAAIGSGIAKGSEKTEVGWGVSHPDSSHPVTHVYADACRSAGALEPFDGTLQGFVDALDAQAGTDATVTDVTLAGRPAKRVDLVQAAGLDRATCRHGAGGPLQIWADPGESDFYAFGPGSRGFVHTLDIDGELVVFGSNIGPQASASNVAELEAIVESIRIGR